MLFQSEIPWNWSTVNWKLRPDNDNVCLDLHRFTQPSPQTSPYWQCKRDFRPPVGKERSGTPGGHHKRLIGDLSWHPKTWKYRKGQKRPLKNSRWRIGFAKQSQSIIKKGFVARHWTSVQNFRLKRVPNQNLWLRLHNRISDLINIWAADL